jgi:hypothetical protein
MDLAHRIRSEVVANIDTGKLTVFSDRIETFIDIGSQGEPDHSTTAHYELKI